MMTAVQSTILGIIVFLSLVVFMIILARCTPNSDAESTSYEVTNNISNEVTKNSSDEVTKNTSYEVTKNTSYEVTKNDFDRARDIEAHEEFSCIKGVFHPLEYFEIHKRSLYDGRNYCYLALEVKPDPHKQRYYLYSRLLMHSVYITPRCYELHLYDIEAFIIDSFNRCPGYKCTVERKWEKEGVKFVFLVVRIY